MRRFFLVTFLTTLLLLAQEEKICNTVQLTSTINNEANLKMLQGVAYPYDCKVMGINSHLTVRCGCYSSIKEAQQRLEELQDEYSQASITRTYKYRFDEGAPKASTATKKSNSLRTSDATEDSELRLMVQIFLYKGDLEGAYKVAQIGYKEYPNSYFWNEKMATICKWTDRPARAMKHLKKLYDIRYDPKIENELINYGKTTYQYENIEPLVLTRVQKNPTEENIDLLITIYKQTGFPEKVITILDSEYERTKNPILLTKALGLALEIGDLDIAKKYVDIITQQKPFTKENAALVARYYYILRDINTAYLSLENAKNSQIVEDANNSKELEYFELKSNLGWYLQKNLPAATASKALIDVNKARLSDYERVAIVYQDIDSSIAMNAVKEGYLKFKLSYMFYSYANDSINKKKFDELEILLANVDEKSSPLVKESMYWVIKSKLYNHKKEYILEEEMLNKALALSPDDSEIKTALLWHFMEIHDFHNVKLVLLDIEEQNDPSPALYFTLASTYFYLHNIDRAELYMSELSFLQEPIIDGVEYKFLQAYIYQVQNREDLFDTMMLEIYETLKAQRKSDPALKKNRDHLINYLSAAMYVLHPDKFEKQLKKTKNYIDKKSYNELSYSWAMQNSALEKSHKVYKKTDSPELWMQFSNAIVMQHHSDIENMLDSYLHELSQGDLIQQAFQDGQYSLAQSINFNAFDMNSYSTTHYIEQIDLSKERSDKFEIELSHYLRDPLTQQYLKVNNNSYIGDGWDLLSGFDFYKNKTQDQTLLPYVKTNTYNIFTGIQKKGDRFKTSLKLQYNHEMKNYLSLLFDTQYRLSTDLNLFLELAKNKKTDESTQLYLGGKKDLLASWLNYQILNSTTIELRYEFGRYYSQDNIYLGSGKYFRSSLSQQIRNGYPDLRIGIFYDNGRYGEKSGSKGVIDQLQNQANTVLPKDFYNYGLSFSYGEANRNLYTRVWRPYFEVFPYYNSDSDDYTYGLDVGIGGKVFHQDHIRLGISYADTINGIGGNILQFYLNYQFMYSLSKEW